MQGAARNNQSSRNLHRSNNQGRARHDFGNVMDADNGLRSTYIHACVSGVHIPGLHMHNITSTIALSVSLIV